MREGISATLPELAQQLVAREMLQILAEVAGSAPPASGFPPLFNEHQIQVSQLSLIPLHMSWGTVGLHEVDNGHRGSGGGQAGSTL